MHTLQKTNLFGRPKPATSDPHFLRLSHVPREEVFERLHNALNELVAPISESKSYWKTFVLKHLDPEAAEDCAAADEEWERAKEAEDFVG